MIIRGGKNISPAEIEGVLLDAPGVADAAVVGAAHRDLGEVPVAFVVGDGTTEPDPVALADRCRERLSSFEVPSSIRITDAIPRTGSGKIKRFVLVDRIPDTATSTEASGSGRADGRRGGPASGLVRRKGRRMELSNSFVVDAPIEATWRVLTDLARVAPCLPGASLTVVDGDDHHGTVRITVGPVTGDWAGTARLVERDDAAHRGVVRVEAREIRDRGGASGTITARLTEHGEGTEVCLLTDLVLSGRPTRFGRGVLSDVGAKLIGRFASRLEVEILSDGADGPAPADQPVVAHHAVATGDDGPAPSGLAGPTLRRALPALGAAGAALLAGFALGRWGRRRAGPGRGVPTAGPTPASSSSPARSPVTVR